MSEPTRLLDVNVLLALVAPAHEHHVAAHRWFAGVHSWATTPMTEAGLLRLVANPAVTGAAFSPADAIQLLRRLREQPGQRFVGDEASFADPRIEMSALVGHRQATDFHLVNLAAGAGLVLATFDAKLAAALAEPDRAHVEVVPV